MFKKILVLFVALLWAGAGQVCFAAEKDSQLLKAGVSFTPPEGWQKGQAGVSTLVNYANPESTANITIAFPKETSSDAFEASIGMVRTSKSPIFEEKTTFLGAPCYIFTLKNVNSSGVKTKAKYYQFYKNGKMHIVVYNAAEEAFDLHLPAFQTALESYNVVK